MTIKILVDFMKLRILSSFTLMVALQTKVDNPLATMENFNRQFQINKKEQEAVEWGWSKEGGDTMFNIVNAYTRGSQFEGLSAESLTAHLRAFLTSGKGYSW